MFPRHLRPWLALPATLALITVGNLPAALASPADAPTWRIDSHLDNLEADLSGPRAEDPAAGLIHFTHSSNGEIRLRTLDVHTRTLGAESAPLPLNRVNAMRLSADGTHLLVLGRDAAKNTVLLVADRSSGTVERTVTGLPKYANILVEEPEEGTILVLSAKGISVVAPGASTATAETAVPNLRSPNFKTAAWDPVNRMVWAASTSQKALIPWSLDSQEWDTRSLIDIGTYSAGGTPTGGRTNLLEVDGARKRMYAVITAPSTENWADRLAVIDLEARTIIGEGTAEIGHHVLDLDISPTSGRPWTTSTGDNLISEVDPGTLTATTVFDFDEAGVTTYTATIPGPDGPTTGARTEKNTSGLMFTEGGEGFLALHPFGTPEAVENSFDNRIDFLARGNEEPTDAADADQSGTDAQPGSPSTPGDGGTQSGEEVQSGPAGPGGGGSTPVPPGGDGFPTPGGEAPENVWDGPAAPEPMVARAGEQRAEAADLTWIITAYATKFTRTGLNGTTVAFDDNVWHEGAGVVHADGSVDLTWSGGLHLKHYSFAGYGGVYTRIGNPVLHVGADGSGTLTMEVRGHVSETNQSKGYARVPIATFAPGALTIDRSGERWTVTGTPEYAGRPYTDPDDGRTSTDSFPTAFITHLPPDMRAWWFATGSGGDKDKPAAPLDVTFRVSAVSPSEAAEGTQSGDGSDTAQSGDEVQSGQETPGADGAGHGDDASTGDDSAAPDHEEGAPVLASMSTSTSRAVPGERMTVTVEGLTSTEDVTFTLHSEPIFLGTAAVVGSNATLAFALPDVAPGTHHVVATQGGRVVASTALEVNAPAVPTPALTGTPTPAPETANPAEPQPTRTVAAPSGLAETGADLSAATLAGSLLLAGAALTLVRRRS